MNEHVLPEVASRNDIEQFEQRLERKFHGLEQATRADIARLGQKFDNTIQRIEATCGKRHAPCWAETLPLAAF